MARVKDWNQQVESAPNGEIALRIAISFLLAQLKKMSEFRAEDADAARRHIALEIAKFATSVTRRRGDRDA